jgi:hypothetical protein
MRLLAYMARGSRTLAVLALSSLALQTGSASPWVTNGSLNVARNSHTACLLPSGQVLLVGGVGTGGFLINSELYDPPTGVPRLAGSVITTPR